ncbi:hypothetical protein K5549_013235 [Capra hircus]|nr:hypothetical protein K5549_013235 [Capra hircus]
MAATTGLTLLVLLLYCGQGADLPPINMSSGTATTTNKTNVQEDMPGVFDEILVQEMLEPNRSSFFEAQKPLPTLPTITTSTTDSSIHESDQLSVPEGFHKLADLSPISLETEDKILNEPSLDASYRTSGPEDYRDSQTSGTADSLHSNGKKHPKTDQQLKQSVLDMILQNIGKSSGNSLQ